MLAFVHIEKCGGTTLLHLLRRKFGIDHFDVIPSDKEALLFGPQDLRRLLRLRPRAKSIAGHSVRLQSNLESALQDVSYYTLLRDPLKRYVSDFRHFVDLLGFPDNFEQWLDLEERHDFQTRAIAGELNLDSAKELLSSRFAFVGLLEDYAGFVDSLRLFALPYHLDVDYRVSNVAGRRKSRGREVDVDRYREEIIERNRLDIELYEFARTTVLPGQRERFASEVREAPAARRRLAGLRDFSRLYLNRIYRNLIYKPYMGYPPMKPHALPPYRGWSKRSG